MYLNTYF